MKKFESYIKKLIALSAVLMAFLLNANAQERGKATYYSHRLHGARMSDGSKYHRDSMTCAHKTYPLGTTLRVRNIKNDKEVYVKVTDRGPFGRSRIIDLSYAAAKKLDIIRMGVASVQVEKVEPWVPFRDERSSTVPQLKLTDPNTGEYVTLAEAKAAANKDLEKKTKKIAVAKLHKGKKSEPRYRIMRNVLSAENK